MSKSTLALALFFISSSALANNLACSLVGGKITNQNDCTIEANRFAVEIRNLGVCTSEPTPSDVSSCEFFDLVPGTFVITPDSESILEPTSVVPGGEYSWVVYYTGATFEVSFDAEFGSTMLGAGSTSGPHCWTNGKAKNIYGGQSPSRTDWTVDCGSSPPDSVPTNSITIDSFQSASFVSSDTIQQPSGRFETNYLLNNENGLAQSASEVVGMLGVVPVSPSLVIPNDPKDQSLTFFYDRSQGAWLQIDQNGADTEVPYLDVGIIEVEIQSN